MDELRVEMNFCRRCGIQLRHVEGPVYTCTNGHTIFLNASPAVGLVVINQQNEVLLLKRAIEPGKGMLDLPGGYCDGPESLEQAVAREVGEETGLDDADYTKPQYVLSGIDSYRFGGEILPVISFIFSAKLIGDKQPVAGDDADTAEWIPLDELDMEKVYFPVVRAGLEAIIAAQ